MRIEIESTHNNLFIFIFIHFFRLKRHENQCFGVLNKTANYECFLQNITDGMKMGGVVLGDESKKIRGNRGKIMDLLRRGG